MFPDEKYMTLKSNDEDIKFAFLSYLDFNRGCPCQHMSTDSEETINPLFENNKLAFSSLVPQPNALQSIPESNLENNINSNSNYDFLPNSTSPIRILNASPYVGAIDVYIDNSIIQTKLGFCESTPYTLAPVYNSKITIYKSGDNTKPLLENALNFLGKKIYTLAIFEENNKFHIFPIIDDIPSNLRYSLSIKFVNLLAYSPLLTLTLEDGKPLFQYVKYKEITNYFLLPDEECCFNIYDNNYNLKSIKHPSTLFEPNNHYTIFILGDVTMPNSIRTAIYKDNKNY